MDTAVEVVEAPCQAGVPVASLELGDTAEAVEPPVLEAVEVAPAEAWAEHPELADTGSRKEPAALERTPESEAGSILGLGPCQASANPTP